MTLVPVHAPRLTLQDGREIAVCVVYDFMIGKFISVVDKQQNGEWAALSGSGSQWAVFNPNDFDAEVAAAGGEKAWLGAVGIPRINKILADNYAVNPADITYKLNAVLGDCRLTVKNGVAGFYP